MKRSRIRKNKKTNAIMLSGGFRKPFQVIVDGSFIKAIGKVENGVSQLQSVLDDYPKYIITKCEYEKYKSQIKPGDFSGKCEIFKCKHDEIKEDCVKEMIGDSNKHHYILASSDQKKLKYRDEVKKLPIIKIKNSVISVDTGDMELVKSVFKGTPASKQELKRLNKMFGVEK